jgi:hypothetical protein
VATRLLACAIAGTLLGLAITTAAAARDCRDETPLPPDVRLVAPAADVPADIARFAGVWVGPWKEAGGADSLCATLVVEEVLPSGHARVVYSHGTWEPLQIRFPSYLQAAGRIADGELRFALPVIGGGPLAYRFTAGGLAGTYRGEGHHAAARAPDLAAIGCRRRLTATTAPPTPRAPRDRLTASQLLAGTAAAAPVHNDYFLPVGSAGPARHALRGTLTIAAASGSGAREGCLSLPVPAPGFSVEVVTHGEHLVPVTRGVIGTTMPAIVVSPGRVWSEPEEGVISVE